MLPALIMMAASAASPAPQGLTLPVAISLSRAAIDACAADGLAVSASVVDAHGVVLVVLRNEASPKPPVAASRKAATAVLFDAPGLQLEAKEKADPAFAARIAADPDHLNAHGGSLPLHADGVLVGGLAVADTSHEAADRCARAALAGFPQFQ